jgi:hypothetical protein
MTAGAAEPRVSVERLDAVCLVPTTAPAEEVQEVRWRLDRVLRRDLQDAVGGVLAGLLGPDNQSVWLIKTLDVGVTADLQVDDHALAAELARGIAEAVRATVAAGPDGDRVVHFSDRAAYLAQFVADLAEGAAQANWRYAGLGGLEHLPPGTAVREALAREPALGPDVLARLAGSGRLNRVLRALSERDAQALLGACFASGPVRPSRAVVDAVLAAWEHEPPSQQQGGPARATGVLRLAAAAWARSGRALPAGAIRSAAEQLLLLAEELASGVDPAELMASLAGGPARAVGAAPRPAAATRSPAALALLAAAAAGDRGWIERILEALRPPAPRRVAPDRGMLLASAFAGVFLLLPALQELDADGLLRALAGPAGQDPLRLALLTGGLAGPRAAEPAGDPGVLLAAGVDRAPPGTLQAAPGADGPAVLLRRLVALGRVRAEGLAAEVAAPPDGREVLVLRDLGSDALAYASLAADAERALHGGLDLVRDAVGRRPELLLLAGPLEALAGSARLAAAADRVLPSEQAAEVELAESWRQRARSTTADLEALWLPGLAADAKLDCAVAAHALVRGFAARLRGFDRSGIAYLQQTFLGGTGVIRVAGAAVEVELPRSPLHIVLQLAGVDGQRFAVPWLPGREITLRLPEP